VREAKDLDYSCDWAVLVRNEDASNLANWDWRLLTNRPAQGLWTDEYSNVFGAIRW
jgi:hypothetical protein